MWSKQTICADVSRQAMPFLKESFPGTTPIAHMLLGR